MKNESNKPKTEQHVSGSKENIDDNNKKNENNIELTSFEENLSLEFDPNKVNQILDKILNIAWSDTDLEKNFEPSYVMKTKNKSEWLFSISKKCFFEIQNMADITGISIASDKTSYCVINNDLFEIDNNFIHCLGWN